MPKYKRSHSRSSQAGTKTKVSISDIEKRSVVLLLVIVLLMFAFTPLVIIYNKRSSTSMPTTPMPAATPSTNDNNSTTSDTINSILSSSNSDILTTPTPTRSETSLPSLKPYVDSLGKNISSYVGDKIESTVSDGFDSLTHLRLHA